MGTDNTVPGGACCKEDEIGIDAVGANSTLPGRAHCKGYETGFVHNTNPAVPGDVWGQVYETAMDAITPHGSR
jgi:hypothetical protein